MASSPFTPSWASSAKTASFESPRLIHSPKALSVKHKKKKHVTKKRRYIQNKIDKIINTEFFTLNIDINKKSRKNKKETDKLLNTTKKNILNTIYKIPVSAKQSVKSVPKTPQSVPTTPQSVPTTPQSVPTTPQSVPTTPQSVPSPLNPEPNAIEKNIKSYFGGRSFNRIQMQIPFGKSSIIFLVSNISEHSSFWTNIIIDLTTYDVDNNAGKNTFKLKDISRVWNDGIVVLPKVFNFNGKIDVVAPTPTKCCLRVIDGTTDAGGMNALVDQFRNTEQGMFYQTHAIAKEGKFKHLMWTCPDVPPGGIVLWHGFHTTKGDKDSIHPKGTMFLDYSEKNTLPKEEYEHYRNLITKQPFDPGSGNPNTRGARATIEFNAAKNISQIPKLPNTKLIGGDEPNETMGKIEIVKSQLLEQGWAVIVPTKHGDPHPSNCTPWYMNSKELDYYQNIRDECKKEFERFLTYFIVEREIRILTCWLQKWAPDYDGMDSFWELLCNEVELFNMKTKKFKFLDRVRSIIKKNGSPTNVEQLQQKYENNRKIPMTLRERQQFHYNSWCYILLNSRFLDINGKSEDQEKCWFGMFGGLWKGDKTNGKNAARMIYNDPYFMYWRLKMGSQKPSDGDPAMAVGTSLEDVSKWIEKLISKGNDIHDHRRTAQGGGAKIASDSGMGPATTYMHGDAHLEIQTGKIGSTLASIFYKDPIVVLERFRVKTHGSWGAGHVDHDVKSRSKLIKFD